MLSKRIRAAVIASGHYRVLDRSKADHTPPYRHLNFKACIFDWARKRGSKLVLVTWVQKESRMRLMVNVALIDTAEPGNEIAGGSVDL